MLLLADDVLKAMVSPDIPDRYLSELFAMKVREMMIHFAAGRA